MAVTTAVALAAAGTAAGVYGASQDRKINKENTKNAEKQRAESQAFIEKSVNQARGDLFKLFPAAQESRRSGIQAGLDLYSQTIPAQLDSFKAGNVAAQNQLIQGMPQQINALTGGPVNPNFQAVQLKGIEGLTMPQLPPGVDIGKLMNPGGGIANA